MKQWIREIGIVFFVIQLLGFEFLIAQNIQPDSTDVVKQNTLEGYDSIATFYYPDGTISSSGTMCQGQPDGYWKSFHENGVLKSEGNRKNFQLDSTWKFYDPKGNLFLEINYLNGVKEGIKTSWLDQEVIREQYKKDIKEGVTEYYHREGWKKKDIPYAKGMKEGIGREFSKDGEIITITTYKRGYIVDRQRINRRDHQGRKQGAWMQFWDNSTIKEEGRYRNDLKHGYFKTYDEKGSLLEITKYLNGILQTEAVEIQKLQTEKMYYPDGTIQSVTLYRNGVKEGISREYAEDGTLERALDYQNGVVVGEGLVVEDGSKNGPWKEFYKDGVLKAEGNYTNDTKTGLWKYYHPNGQLEQIGKYNAAGDPEGPWRWYYASGNMLREENYYRGKRDGYLEEFTEDGGIIEQGEFLDGYKEGPWITVIGDYCQKGTFRDGLRTGLWQTFLLEPGEASMDSVLLFQGNYIEDLPDGEHIQYWDKNKIRLKGTYVMGKKEGNWILYNYDGSVFLITTYVNGTETRYDGVKIKPPLESEELEE
jgi:uncharacterized protein